MNDFDEIERLVMLLPLPQDEATAHARRLLVRATSWAVETRELAIAMDSFHAEFAALAFEAEMSGDCGRQADVLVRLEAIRALCCGDRSRH